MFRAANTQATINQLYQPYLQIYICKEWDAVSFTYPNLITFFVKIPWKIIVCNYWWFQYLYFRMNTSLNNGLYYRIFLFGPVTKSCQHTNEISSSINLEMCTPAKRVLPLKGKLRSIELAVFVNFLSASTVLQRLKVKGSSSLSYWLTIKSNSPTYTETHTLVMI